MRILFLGHDSSPVAKGLRELGENVIARQDPLSLKDCDVEFVVSYGYRYIVRPEILERFPGRAINLHIAYLPWNRGAYPNVWSHYDGTPGGVTIHHMDNGIDTGDVISQRRVLIPPDATLRTSYEQLKQALEGLWFQEWPAIRDGVAPRRPQVGPGSIHRVRDLKLLDDILTLGWDTPVADVVRAGRRARGEDSE